MNNNISIYPSIDRIRNGKTIPLDMFLEGVRSGKWQDFVLPIRVIKDEKERREAKSRVPYVTISGEFKERTDAGIVQHSGYIGIDIDDVSDINGLKQILCADPYVYAAFTSIGGHGLCLLFKIEPVKHREAFQGISEYLFEKYDVVVDPTSINVSRPRYISFDPDIYVADDVKKFTQYPKNKPPKKIERVIYAQNDFEALVQQVVARRLNLTGDNYHDYIRIGFALAHQFGEQGREYFHLIAQYSSKYSPDVASRQYSNCLKAHGSKTATIATFYYYCKEAGLQIYSDRTRKIAYSAIQGKRGGLNQQQVITNLEKFEDITDSADIVRQVFEGDIEVKGEETLVEQLEMWMRQNYVLRRNEVTLFVESEGVPLTKVDLNSIYLRSKKIFEKINYDLVDRMIHSDFIPNYHPFFEFFNENMSENTDGHIERMFASVDCKDPAFLQHFGKKWLVGAVSAIHGAHSPLVLVLIGGQDVGKTQFFRRLLPPELGRYYAESKLDAGKDDNILMTQKLIVMDDEMGGKSKQESKRLNDITSKQVFSLREPYGQFNVDLTRLAVLCGTTNHWDVLNDSTGNRRIIPIAFNGYDFDAYNRVDKRAVWMEAYRLYRAGWNWQVRGDDIRYLNKDAAVFETVCAEAELILKYFEAGVEQWTATEIKVKLEMLTQQRLSLDRLGKELKRLGYVQIVVRGTMGTRRVYAVKFLSPTDLAGRATDLPADDLPF